MPKMKSHSGAKKRFRRTAGGRWKHKRAALRHLLVPARGGNSRDKRRRGLLNAKDGETIDRFLPYGR